MCAAIYAPYVRETAVSFEGEPPTPAQMAERIAAALRTHAWIVLEDDECIVGYAYGGPHRKRAAYRFSCEVSVYGLYVGAVLVALLLAVSLAAPAMLGMGDVKLALLILCALDAFAPLALLITLELYALIALYLLSRRGRAALKISLPLAPITAAACLIVLLL